MPHALYACTEHLVGLLLMLSGKEDAPEDVSSDHKGWIKADTNCPRGHKAML